jgi:ribosomal protein S18 acetylase RimI-like enzyme
LEITTNFITSEKIEEVTKIQKLCYIKLYWESGETFTGMVDVYPKGCIGLYVNDLLSGYVFFHPYQEDRVKPLNHVFKLDGTEDCVYLHDLAIIPNYRGLGLSRILMDLVDLETCNIGFVTQCLVAVQGSHIFWQKYGFKKIKEVENYGLHAYYMKRRIQSTRNQAR